MWSPKHWKSPTRCHKRQDHNVSIIWASLTVRLVEWEWLHFLFTRRSTTNQGPHVSLHTGSPTKRRTCGFCEISVSFHTTFSSFWGLSETELLATDTFIAPLNLHRTIGERNGIFGEMRIGRGNRSTGRFQRHPLNLVLNPGHSYEERASNVPFRRTRVSWSET
jgi:hypothetical protein